MRKRKDIDTRKVHPVEISNNSITNISQNEVLENSNTFNCRFCNETLETISEELELIFPCTCIKPIHKCCLQGEMKDLPPTKLKRMSLRHRQKRYNCSKCAEVIRFNSQQQLKCRSGKEIVQFSKQNCGMCVALSVAAFIMCSMMIFLIVITTSVFKFQNPVLLEATIIGFSIAIAVLFIIVMYFFISQVLVKISLKVEIIKSKDRTKKQDQQISIEECT